MSLADLIYLAQVTRMPRRMKEPGQLSNDWQKRNRPHVNAYRRQWRALRRTA